jgi:hypothetical protein
MPFGAGAASELAAFEFGLGTGNDQDVLEERETVLMIRIGAVVREKEEEEGERKGNVKKRPKISPRCGTCTELR